jgi:anaerobic dimethyl sulfoxide reductase subunit A
MIKAFMKFFEGTGGMWDNPLLDALFSGLTREEAIFEYDRLFRGTDPDVVIPLWASGDYLMDSTTLEVLHAYNRFGYIPRRMEGNPPDYIGNQRKLVFSCKEAFSCKRV